jgi:hypothetical protein
MERVAATPVDRPVGEPEAAERAAIGRTQWGQHPINLRLSLPLLFGRYYVVVLAGKERRSQAGLMGERANHPLPRFGNVVCICALGAMSTVALFGLVELLLFALLRASGLFT